MVFALPPTMADFTLVITNLLDTIGPAVVTIVTACLLLAGGIFLVRAGFRWIKGFVGGR